MELDSRRKRGRLSPTHPRDYMRSMGRSSLSSAIVPRENSQLLPRGHNKMEEAFSLENIAKERKVIPDPIDDRKFQE